MSKISLGRITPRDAHVEQARVLTFNGQGVGDESEDSDAFRKVFHD
jgi:hypothetical protein